ncbi:MAG: type III pantothenate kinase [Nitrospirae bacterium]|nr:type III pantothenate kinase [Nitrospirota bacterium]
MLLLIDVGNTNLKACLYDDAVKALLRLPTAEVITMPHDELRRALAEFAAGKNAGVIEGAVISSVAEGVSSSLEDAVKKAFNIKPLLVGPGIKTGLRLLAGNPEGIGADRLANAAAANKFYSGNKVIVDFGTATTFSVVTESGGFIGGAIMPGLDISADALNFKTSKLPRAELVPPRKVLGGNTTDAILSGIIIGHAGAVERIMEDMAKETGMDYTLVITGGRCGLMAPFIRLEKHIDNELTFKGLKVIYGLNS